MLSRETNKVRWAFWKNYFSFNVRAGLEREPE